MYPSGTLWESPWSVSFQFPQQVDDGFGFPREMSSKLLARTHCHEIVNGLPFIQLFSSRLSLVTVAVVQGAGQLITSDAAAADRPAALGSAQPLANTLAHDSGSRWEQFVSESFQETRRQSRGMELQTFPEGPSIRKKHKFQTPCVAMMQDEQWNLVFYFNLNRILNWWSFCDAF